MLTLRFPLDVQATKVKEAAAYQSLEGSWLEMYPGNSGDAEHDNTYYLNTERLKPRVCLLLPKSRLFYLKVFYKQPNKMNHIASFLHLECLSYLYKHRT